MVDFDVYRLVFCTWPATTFGTHFRDLDRRHRLPRCTLGWPPNCGRCGHRTGAKHNILIKDAPTLEQVPKIQSVVLDKTGTLTEGKPRITDVIAAKDLPRIKLLN